MNIIMDNFSISTNIERDVHRDINYIVTPNSKAVFDRIVNNFKVGNRSFNIIGSYGTGKSSFLWAFENNLLGKRNYFTQLNGQFKGLQKFKFFKLVGESRSLREVISERLGLLSFATDKEIFKAFDELYTTVSQDGKVLFIVVDEFGKFLEYAAKHNPEEELYFVQRLAEYANNPERNIVLITTLHQNFGAYSKGLSKEQKQEWDKVRGRLVDISFDEPIQQLLLLAGERIKSFGYSINDETKFNELFELVNTSKLVSNAENLDVNLAKKLYPLDYLAANIIAQALQRYGQNERSLFAFLASKDKGSIQRHNTSEKPYFSVSSVVDYLTLHLASDLEDRDKNPHKQQWQDILTALDKADALNTSDFDSLEKIIKVIGLINIFSKKLGLLNVEVLSKYCTLAMGIPNAEDLIERLARQKIIKFYKHRNKLYFLDGTDVDVEQELLEASGKVAPVTDVVERLNYYYEFPIVPAKAYQYKTGTHRFFKYRITGDLSVINPEGEIDGYINLIFSDKLQVADIQTYSSKIVGAQLFALFTEVAHIREVLFEIDKIDYLIKKHTEDTVAKNLFLKEKQFQQSRLNEAILENLFGDNHQVIWIYKGVQVPILSRSRFNKFISEVCDDVYYDTPVFKNELANKEHLSTPILTARKALINDLLNNSDKQNLGYPEDKFPPQKSIYLTLLKNTGIHRLEEGNYILGEPTDESFKPLWDSCLEFFEGAKFVKRPLNELYALLKEGSIKAKKGFVEYWIPIFLIIKKEDFALFHNERGYVPYLDSDVFDILHKKPSDFSIKTYSVEGVKHNLLNQYKEITGLTEGAEEMNTSFIKIFSEFIRFHRGLPTYAKNTGRLSAKAKGFRDAVAKAQDPATALFEEIPAGLGFHNLNLKDKPELFAEFVQHINEAIYELRTSYTELLNRVEAKLLDVLSIKQKEFVIYKGIIGKRFKTIKAELLLPKQKQFYSRLTSKLDDRDSWLKSVADVAVGKPIESIKDEEEEVLLHSLGEFLRSLEKLIEIHDLKQDRVDDEIIAIELAQANGSTIKEKVIITPKAQQEVQELKSKLLAILGSEREINQAALIKLLEELSK
jgi:hypothetical protein